MTKLMTSRLSRQNGICRGLCTRSYEHSFKLETETPDFIPPTWWPPNSPDLNPVDYKISNVMQEKSTDLEYMMSVSCEVELWRHGTKWISASLMNQSNSGVLVFAHA